MGVFRVLKTLAVSESTENGNRKKGGRARVGGHPNVLEVPTPLAWEAA